MPPRGEVIIYIYDQQKAEINIIINFEYKVNIKAIKNNDPDKKLSSAIYSSYN